MKLSESRPPGRDRHDALTERDHEVLRLMARGATNAEIKVGLALHVSPRRQ